MRISDWSSDVCSSDLRTASACGVSHPHGHARHACPPSLIHHQEKSMALMFPRLARNFIRNGYFPTDEPTLERALSALAPSPGAMSKIGSASCREGGCQYV